MSAPRASARALRQLSASSVQVRNLHMTGPATFSTLLTSERPAMNLPGDIDSLRAECQRRKLPSTGTQAELTARLSAHDVANTRSFTSAIQDSSRPKVESTHTGKPVRHFNTSRSLKAVGDSSTIDFAYLPDFDPDTGNSPVIRVPILPQTVVAESSRVQAVEDTEETGPRIMTVSADGTHIYAPAAMSDVSDNNSVDFQGMAAKVAGQWTKPVEEQAGMLKELWSDLMDDVLGPKRNSAKA